MGRSDPESVPLELRSVASVGAEAERVPMPCRRAWSTRDDLTVVLSEKCVSEVETMSAYRAARAAQALLLVAAVAYMSLLLYQSVSSMQGGVRRQQTEVDADPVTIPSRQPPGGGVAEAAMTAATATSTPPTTSLSDIFLSVKTTSGYHRYRLPSIIKTWFQLAKEQTWFFTDADEAHYQKITNGHMINTNCSSSHNRNALCCKMSVELDVFLDSDKKWFCHFDDDNYVNIPRLVEVLGDYSPQQDWYLGKPSIRAPLEIINRDNKSQNISFWFATGGAGFCLSRALALKMVPVAGGGRFISIGEKIRLPDDVTMGYIIEHLLRKPLTVVDQFHSHLEPMKFLRQETFHEQITFSYSRYSKDEVNVLKIDGFPQRLDPTRFLSLHCFLFPQTNYCR